VRLLFDQNLAASLVQRLADVYPGSQPVRDVGLGSADDATVWAYAAEHGLTLVSKDADFHQISFLRGAPPKAVWIRRGNCSTRDIEEIPRRRHADIVGFDEASDATFLIVG
jgi:predicted nuclease of predicted toxin-antitoxin system